MPTAARTDTVRAPLIYQGLAARMSDAPIATIELHHIALPTRREHKWTGLTEPIGGYVLVRMTDTEGLKGWGEAPALKDWGGEFGRYFGKSRHHQRDRHPTSHAGGQRLRAGRDRRTA